MSELDSASYAKEVNQKLGLGRPRRKLLRLVLSFCFLLVLVGGGVLGWRAQSASDAAPRYETVKANRGDIRVTVSATGKIESVGAVEIGAEISGRVEEVLVDFNQEVKKDQIMAKINTEQLNARLKEARAQAMVSVASVNNAKANAEEAVANANRVRALAEHGLASKQELEAVVAAEKRAQSSVATAIAQQAVSGASVEAAVSNLSKATIRSPVDGVVLSRSVEPGQTVASSLQAPILFIVARDLTTMRLMVDIGEADVGVVKDGQKATFTVDAYPKRKFEAEVKSIKNVPTTGQDIVTYQAELKVSNEERLLRPGMTATATIITQSREGVLLVPNAALRFSPPAAAAGAGSGSSKSPSIAIPGFSRPRMGPGGGRGGQGKRRDGSRVWVLQGGVPAPIKIKPGPSDGTNTEVEEGELSEGADVVVDMQVGAS